MPTKGNYRFLGDVEANVAFESGIFFIARVANGSSYIRNGSHRLGLHTIHTLALPTDGREKLAT
jgi:hypothetical protein